MPGIRETIRLRSRRSEPAVGPVLAAALLTALAGCDPGGGPLGPGDAAKVEISAPSTFVETGQKLLLSAAVKDASGRAVQGAQVTWTSRNPAVAEVVGGLVTGRSAGTAYVRASAGSAADSVLVTVEGPSAGALVVWPDTLFLIRGRTGKLFVELRDPSGKPTTPSAIFSSGAPEVATVNGAGEVQGIAPGAASVTVTAGLRSVQVPVRVVTGDRYTVRVLGSPVKRESTAHDVNNRGEVVGWAYTPPSEQGRAFLWRRGQIVELEIPAGFNANEAVAVNDSGTVIGVAALFSGSGTPRRQLWIWRSGLPAPLAAGGAVLANTVGGDVNGRGQVVGYRVAGWYPAPEGPAFLWEDGRATPLGLPEREAADPYTPSGAVPAAVNARGEVAVTVYSFPFASPSTGDRSTVHLWANGRFTRVSLPGSPRWATARDLNDRGHLVGSFAAESGQAEQGFHWDGSQVTVLAPMASPTGINNHGDVVGDRFLRRAGKTLDLNEMVVSTDWEIEEAKKINDLGQIVGTARNVKTRERKAVLLTPAS